MAKFGCRCGRSLRFNYLVDEDYWKIVSGDGYRTFMATEATIQNLSEYSLPLLRCSNCDRLWCFWKGWQHPASEYMPLLVESPSLRSTWRLDSAAHPCQCGQLLELRDTTVAGGWFAVAMADYVVLLEADAPIAQMAEIVSFVLCCPRCDRLRAFWDGEDGEATEYWPITADTAEESPIASQ